MSTVLSFQECLDKTSGQRRHLLLGNGFSIALFSERFKYESLLKQAIEDGIFEEHPQIPEAFEVLGTTDFEVVLQALIGMSALIHLYGDEGDAKAAIEADVERLKTALVEALAGRHPARLSEISEDQFECARTFLRNFAGKALDNKGKIYSLNYDLILYWTLMHNPEPEWTAEGLVQPDKSLFIGHDDGFRNPEDPNADYVAWDVKGGSNSQNVHYLHGALHLFDAGIELQKYCWERAGSIPLMDQIRTALDDQRYPVFVSEGHSDSKLEKIMHSGYLLRSYKSFAEVCNKPQNNLFIFGHSLADSDNHILKLIESGRIARVFISIFGDPSEEWNKPIVKRVVDMKARRDSSPLNVYFFDAQSANVWG